MNDDSINLELETNTPLKKVGDSISFSSPELEKGFYSFFYRISVKGVRVTLFISLIIYALFYLVALPLSYPTDHELFQPAFLIISCILSILLAVTYTSFYLNNIKLGNTVIAIISCTSFSLSAFIVESISPVLLFLLSQPMMACTVTFGLHWVRSIIVSMGYFSLSIFLASRSALPLSEYTLGLFNLFGFMLIGICTGYMNALLKINSFILKSNREKLIQTLKTNENKYRELSLKDGLTHLFNRRYFDDIGEIKTAIANRNSSELHLLVIDIDKFKEYNDTYGHPEGDAALLSVALLLKKTFRRPSDLIFRIGGEEFAVLTECDDSNSLSLYTQALHDNLAHEAIPHASSNISSYLTISIGIANLDITSNGNDNFAELYNRADKALYHAKQSGRSQTIIY